MLARINQDYSAAQTIQSRLKNTFESAAFSHVSSILLLCAFYWIVAAGSYSGFMGKWALRDTNRHGYPIDAMLNGTAPKPWVYRQFAPLLANLADRVTPSAAKQYLNLRMGNPHDPLFKLGPEATYTRASSAGKPELRYRYLIVYYLSFASAFFSLFVLRRIALDLGIGRMASTFCPAVFLLAVPYLMTIGGYFYDYIELFFMSAAFLLALRGNVFLLIALTLPATLNKETFIFYLPALYPLLRCRLSRKYSFISVAAAVAAAGAINVLLKLRFWDSPGGVAEFHLFDTLQGHMFLSTYFHPEVTYGIIGPEGAFIGTLALVLIILFRALASCPIHLKQHLFVAALINIPLYLLFGIPGELRNLSFLYVGFVILIGYALERTKDRNIRDDFGVVA